MEITFSQLLYNFPLTENPCTDARGNPRYRHQCAIRLSVALLDRSGMDHIDLWSTIMSLPRYGSGGDDRRFGQLAIIR